MRQIAITTECIKNHQTKTHFAHDQKHAKKRVKKSIENNSSRNRCTVTSNDTFQVFHIPTNKVSENLLQKQSSGGIL